jgi:hypothetical protein
VSPEGHTILLLFIATALCLQYPYLSLCCLGHVAAAALPEFLPAPYLLALYHLASSQTVHVQACGKTATLYRHILCRSGFHCAHNGAIRGHATIPKTAAVISPQRSTAVRFQEFAHAAGDAIAHG